MRILTIILVIQSAMLAWLLLRVDAMDRHLGRLGTMPITAAEAPAPHQPAAGTIGISTVDSPPAAAVSPEQLRAILREELGRMPDEPGTGPAAGRSEAATGTAADRAHAAVGEPRQADQVAQDIDYYVGVGRISDAEMGRLKLDIARLPDQERRRMLARLAGALSSGQLDGRL